MCAVQLYLASQPAWLIDAIVAFAFIASLSHVFQFYRRWQRYKSLPPEERSKDWKGNFYVQNSWLAEASLFWLVWTIALAVGSLGWLVYKLLKLRGIL